MKRYSRSRVLSRINRKLLQGDCLSSSSNNVPRSMDVPLLKRTLDIDVFDLSDPNFHDKLMEMDVGDFDPTKPLPKPDITHTFTISREFSEDEKVDIYEGLVALQQINKYNKYNQSQTFKQKAIDLDIFMFDFEHVNKEGMN